MGPFRAGIFYGIIAVAVALAANLHFLLLDASGTPGWIMAVVEDFRTTLALAAFLMLGALAAMRTKPQRLDEGVPYRSLLLRDCTLAATIVAVMAGLTLMIVVFLQATVLSGSMQSYAADAAPRIIAYIEELGDRFSDPADPVTATEVEGDLAPPALGSLGQSISNFVLRALLLGIAGTVVGLMRARRISRSSRSGKSQQMSSRRDYESETPYPYEEPEGPINSNGSDRGKE